MSGPSNSTEQRRTIPGPVELPGTRASRFAFWILMSLITVSVLFWYFRPASTSAGNDMNEAGAAHTVSDEAAH